MADRIDRFVQLLKWPVAILAIVFLPGAGWAFIELVKRIATSPGPIIPFVAGMFVYLALWFLLFRRPGFGSLFSTFEHELTHAVFAWLTLHKVVGLRTSWRDGGEVRYRGRGNWLIVIAPYFFPTLSVIALLVLILIPEQYQSTASAILGVTVAYHGTSTWLETHREQPDLKRAGLVFSIAFIPTANLLATGLLVAFAFSGLEGVGAFFVDVGSTTSGWIGDLIALVF